MKTNRALVGCVIIAVVAVSAVFAEFRRQDFEGFSAGDYGTHTNDHWVVSDGRIVSSGGINGNTVYFDSRYSSGTNHIISSPRLSRGVQQMNVRYRMDDAPHIWINEVDYDMPGTDTNEWIELCGAAGVVVTNYELVFVNQDGAEYETKDLAGSNFTISNEVNGFGFCIIGRVAAAYGGVSADYTPSGWSGFVQNGPTDAIILRDKSTTTDVYVLDYEGDNTHTDEDQISSAADNASDADTTIYLTGSGAYFGNFSWDNGANQGTPGALNDGQYITCASAVYTLETSSDGASWSALTNLTFDTSRRVRIGFNPLANPNGDLMNDYHTKVLHWNDLNYNNGSNWGYAVTGFVDSAGHDVDELIVRILDDFAASGNNNAVTNGIYPPSVLHEYYAVDTSDTKAELRIEGLDTNRTYDVSMLPYSALATDTAYFRSGSQMVSMADSRYNYRTLLTLSNLTPDASGHLSLIISNAAAGTVRVTGMEVVWSEAKTKVAGADVDTAGPLYLRLRHDSGNAPVYIDDVYAAPFEGWTNTWNNHGNFGATLHREYTNVYMEAQAWGAGDTVDQSLILHTLMEGDCEISMKVLDLEASNNGAKTGLQARDKMTPGSRFMAVNRTWISRRIGTWYRDVEDNAWVVENSPFIDNIDPPLWLKLGRTNSTFYSYYSTDGQNWGQRYELTLSAFADPCYMGLFVFPSHLYHAGYMHATEITLLSENRGLPDDPYGVTAYATNNQVNFYWTRTPESDGVLLLHKEGSSVTDTPDFGTEYTNGQVLANGARVVYRGGGQSFTHDNVTSASDNYYTLYSYDTSYNGTRSYSPGYALSAFVAGPPAYVEFGDVWIDPDPIWPSHAPHIWATILPFAGATNIQATLYYRSAATGAFTSASMTAMDSTNYRTVNAIPPQNRGETDYYIECTYTGLPDGQFSSPQYYPPEGSNNPATFEVVYSPVFINEIKYNDFNAGTNWDWDCWCWITNDIMSFIELVGPSGFDIENWILRFIDDDEVTVFAQYTITNNPVFSNDFAGWGWWVIGNAYTSGRDQTLTNQLYDVPWMVELINASGTVEQALSVAGSFNGYDRIPVTDNDSYPGTTGICVYGTGDSYADMEWHVQTVTPGSLNASQSLNCVWLEVTDESARETTPATNPAVIRLHRDPAYGPLTVYLEISGTASNGGDYGAIQNIQTFSDGQAYIDLTVTPVDDAFDEDDETVIVEILTVGNNSYYRGSPYAEYITIYDDDRNRPPVVDAGDDTACGSPYQIPATVTDDGKIFTTPTYAWTALSGPGYVTFNATNSLQPSTSFSESGDYVLQLVAYDGQFAVTDSVALTVVGPPEIVSIQALMNSTSIVITFDQVLDEGSAEYTGNYSAPPGNGIERATRIAPMQVQLDLVDPLSPGASYTQEVDGVANEYGSLAVDEMGFKHHNLLRDGAFSGERFFNADAGPWTSGADDIYDWFGRDGWWGRTSNMAEVLDVFVEEKHDLIQVITNCPAKMLTFQFDYRKQAYTAGAAPLWYYIYGFTGDTVNLRLEYDIFIDNEDAGRTSISGAWSVTNNGDPWRGNYRRIANAAGSSAYCRYDPQIADPGVYDVQLFYPNEANAANATAVRIVLAGGSETNISVDQTLNKKTWKSIGEFNLDENSVIDIKGNGTPIGKYALADGVRVTSAEEPDGDLIYELPYGGLLPDWPEWTTHEALFEVETNYTYVAVVFRGGNLNITNDMTNFCQIDNVFLGEANQRPEVDAGDDIYTGINMTNMLNGIATDDGLPLDGNFTYTWSVVTNVGGYTIGNNTQLNTTITFDSYGTNWVRLRAQDGEYTVDDFLVVYVENQPPVPVITAPSEGVSFGVGSNVAFTGYAMDHDDGTITGTQLVWSADAIGMFGSGTSAVTRILPAGVHTVQLAVTDSEGLSATTNITVTVNDSTNLVVLFEYDEFDDAAFNFDGYAFGTVASNLVKNPSFETGDLTHWSPCDFEADGVYDDEAHRGTYAARMADSVLPVGIRQQVPLSQGKGYQVRAWYKTGAGISNASYGIRLEVSAYDFADSPAGAASVRFSYTNTADWAEVDRGFLHDQNNSYLKIYGREIGTDTWVDAISLVPSGKCAFVDWSWDFGDGATSDQQNVTHLYTSNDTYDVTLTVVDAFGNTNSETRQLVITSALPNYVFAEAQSNAFEYPIRNTTIHLSRLGDTGSPLRVEWTWSGTASNGTDFALLTNAHTFGANEADAYVVFEPLQDILLESNETAVLTFIEQAGMLGAPAPGGVTITLYDDDILPPTNLVAEFVTGTTYDIELTWNDRTSGEAGFLVQRREGTGPIDIIVDNADTNNASSSGSWSLKTDGDPWEADYVRVLADPGSSDWFRFYPRVSEARNYRVSMYYPNIGGNSTATPVRIVGAGETNTVYVDQSRNTETWKSLGWFDLNSNSFIEVQGDGEPQYYNVIADAIRVQNDGNDYETVGVAPSNAVSYTDSNLVGSILYYWRVAASNEDGVTRWSDVIAYETPGNPSVLASPKDIEIAEGGSNGFDVVMSKVLLQPYTVTVWRASGDASISAAPTNMVFTPSTWDNPQRVWVSAAEDGDIADESATFFITYDVSITNDTPNTQEVAVTVSDDDGYVQRLLFDVSPAYAESGFGWNNITGDAVVTFTNVVDTNGVPTKVDWVTAEGGAAVGSMGGLEIAGYPETAWKDRWRDADNNNSIRLEDLDPGARYTVKLYSSSGNSYDDGCDIVTYVGDEDPRIISPYLNTELEVWEDVQVDGDGTLDIVFDKLSTYMILNLVDISWKTVQVEAESPTVYVPENGTNTARFRLSYNPGRTIDVDVSPVSGDTNLVVKSGGSMTFNDSNWSNWQTVVFGATADDDATAGEAVFVCNGIKAAGALITVTEVELEAFANPVSVPEGKSRDIKVRPSGPIENTITVTVSKVSGDADLTLSGGTTLIFTPANWSVYQNVAVSAAEDADSDDGSALFRASGGGFPALDITVNEVDNDIAALQVANPTLFVPETGSSNVYVRLTASVVNDTTVTVSKASGDADLTVTGDPVELIFNSGNWSAWQSAVVHSAADTDTLDGSAYIAVSSPGMTARETLALEVDDDSDVDESFTILIDCGMGTALTTGNWNNVYAPWWVDRYWLENMIDTNGADTGIDVYCTDRLETRLFTGLGDGTLYPTSAVGDAFRIQFNTHTNGVLQFQDLPVEAPEFTMSFLGSWNGGQDALMHVTIGSTSVVYNAYGNSTTQAVIDRIEADVNGQFEVHFRRDGTDSAFLNVMRLDYTFPGLKPVATPDPLYVPENGSNTLYVRLSQAVASETTVTVSRLSGDTDLVFAGPTQLVFGASDWNMHQAVRIAAQNDYDPLDGEMTVRLVANGGISTATVIERDDDNPDSILIDFGGLELSTGNWNNLTSYLTNDTPAIANLIDENGDLSGLALYITNSFDGVWNTTVGGEGRYPSAAMRDNLFLAGAGADGGIKIAGLQTNMSYTILMYGYLNTDQGANNTYHEVEGVSDVLDNEDNLSNVTAFALNPTPADGKADVYTEAMSGGNFRKVLSVMEILYQPIVALALETNVVSVPEGDTADLGVRLSAQPANTRTVLVTRVSGDADLSLFAGEVLVFPPASWDTWQYVTFGAEDDVDQTNGAAVYNVRLVGEGAQQITVQEVENDIDRYGYTISKSRLNPAGRAARVGETVQFKIMLTNTGTVELTSVPLKDVYETAFLSYVSSVPASDNNNNDGQIDWADLALSFGSSLASGEVFAVTSTFTAASSTLSLPKTNTAVASPSPSVYPKTNAATYDISSPGYTLTKTMISPPSGTGEVNGVVIFAITVANTGDVELVDVPLRDAYNTASLTYSNATPASDDNVNDGVIDWSDLTVSFGDNLAAGESFVVTARFVAAAAGIETNAAAAVPAVPADEPPVAGTTNTAVYVVVTTGDDQDGDGIPDWFEERHSGGPTSMEPYEDDDGDGHYNIEEWVAYTDPTNAQSYLQISETALESANDYYIIRWTSASNRIYSVLWGTNLFGVFNDLATGLPAVLPENVYTDDVHYTEDSIYYRIDVRMDEQ